MDVPFQIHQRSTECFLQWHLSTGLLPQSQHNLEALQWLLICMFLAKFRHIKTNAVVLVTGINSTIDCKFCCPTPVGPTNVPLGFVIWRSVDSGQSRKRIIIVTTRSTGSSWPFSLTNNIASLLLILIQLRP